MNKRKACLIIADSFQPVVGAGSKRITMLSKHLSKLGWKIYVLTIEKGYRNYIEANSRFIPDNIEVIRTKAFYPRIMNKKAGRITKLVKKGLRKPFRWFVFPDYLAGWLTYAVFCGNKLIREKKIGIIYSSAPRLTSHLVALKIKRATGVNWIAEFRDLLSANPSSYNNFLQRKFSKKIEKLILNECNAVVTVSNHLDEHFKKIYPYEKEKFYILSNGFDPELHENLKFNHEKNHRVFKVCHTGTFYPDRGSTPDYFINAVSHLLKKRLIDPDKIKIDFFGGFPRKSYELLKGSPLSKCIFIKGIVRFEESLMAQNNSDLLLIIIGFEKGYEGETPAKMFEYFGAGKPILAMTCPGAHIGNIIRETNTGKCVFGDNVENIAKALLDYYKEFHINAGHIKYSPRIDKISKYNYVKIAEAADKILKRYLDKIN